MPPMDALLTANFNAARFNSRLRRGFVVVAARLTPLFRRQMDRNDYIT